MVVPVELPELDLPKWEKAKMTLHLMLQIIGKTRLVMTPRKNHWWFATEYLSPRGFTTGNIPYREGMSSFEVTLDVHSPQVIIETSFGEKGHVPLENGLTVAEFFGQYMTTLSGMGIHPRLQPYAYDLLEGRPFSEINEYKHFDQEQVHTFWRVMLWVNSVFNEFSGRFYGKTCPVQLYWHHMDLAVTRFSGKKAPKMDESASIPDKDAYSHEVISFGFWAGDEAVREAAFYSYTFPSPTDLDREPLEPEEALWTESNGSTMAMLTYADLLKHADPRSTLLEFLESTYMAGATLAGWDIEGLRAPPLEEL